MTKRQRKKNEKQLHAASKFFKWLMSNEAKPALREIKKRRNEATS